MKKERDSQTGYISPLYLIMKNAITDYTIAYMVEEYDLPLNKQRDGFDGISYADWEEWKKEHPEAYEALNRPFPEIRL